MEGNVAPWEDTDFAYPPNLAPPLQVSFCSFRFCRARQNVHTSLLKTLPRVIHALESLRVAHVALSSGGSLQPCAGFDRGQKTSPSLEPMSARHPYRVGTLPLGPEFYLGATSLWSHGLDIVHNGHYIIRKGGQLLLRATEPLTLSSCSIESNLDASDGASDCGNKSGGLSRIVLQAAKSTRPDYFSTLLLPPQILLDASDGASDYGNKFGEPLIQGYTRTFGMRLPNGERREWLKPIMFSAGIGQIDHRHLEKGESDLGMLVVKVRRKG